MNVDPQFLHELNGQPPDPWALAQLFSTQERKQLERARRDIDRGSRTVAYVSYENHLASGGGILAVARQLPPRLAQCNSRVIILSPFHAHLKRAPRVPGEVVTTIDVPYGDAVIPTTLYEYVRDGMRWILFGALGFFTAPGDSPYNLPDELLLRDGLFASAAVPRVLQAIDSDRDVVVHVQDWQLAAAALTVKQAVLQRELLTAAVVLTMHNPYDCALSPLQLAAITDRTPNEQWARSTAAGRTHRRQRRATVYECMMPLTDAPISTVSRQYARALVSDPLQTVHLADHLQDVFRRQGLVGVDNGLFMPPIRPFSEEAVGRARSGDSEPILQEKRAKRHVMLHALTAFRPPDAIGWLRHGATWDLTRLPDSIPLFMMFGRLDPGQKGFDLLAAALRRTPPGAAKFVICPMVPEGVGRFVDQWRDLARTRPGDVVVYTSRMGDAYHAIMAGASFCVMPSLHEPFGAATEPYLMGTPVVAHATGGLIQQVVDLAGAPQHATGILFRDQWAADRLERGRQWRRIMREQEPDQRMRHPLYVSLVNGLASALEQAIALHRDRPSDYGRMLSRLYDQARKFSWEKAAAEYTAIYDRASSAEPEGL